jgi:hypothetical protein
MFWWRVEFTAEGGIRTVEQVDAKQANGGYVCFVEAANKVKAVEESKLWLKKVAPHCGECRMLIPGLENVVPTRAYFCKSCLRKRQQKPEESQSSLSGSQQEKIRLLAWPIPELQQKRIREETVRRQIKAASKVDFTPTNVLYAFDTLGPIKFREWLETILRQTNK